MRTAIISDIHGNRTAFEAVLADLRQTSPDLVLHGGDLADGGSSPAEILDEIRDLGWSGVLGNADEMLFRPRALTEFAAGSPSLKALFAIVEEMAAATRDKLGEERIEWLRLLPCTHVGGDLCLVHATPKSCWRAPSLEASDQELAAAYGTLGLPVVVYGHIHRPFIRVIGELTVANTGSVSLSYDGDTRASYLLLDDGDPSIRRVEYDLEREIGAMYEAGIPHASWIAGILRNGRFQMP